MADFQLPPEERALFDGRWRTSVEQGLKPIGSGLERTGISPDHLTVAGLVVAVACAVAVANGRLVLGVVLLTASALPDLLDGAVARARGGGSVRGAFFDSVADRVSDALVLGGIAWYLASTDGGHAALLPFAVLGTSMLISYERAKAEALGFRAKGGLMERAERIIAIAIGLAFSVVLVPILWLMLVLTTITAVQRFITVWRQASAPVAAPTVGSRWRSWRVSRAGSEPVRTHHDRERWRARRSRRAGTRP
jgi:CDP-diacylglycerol--glycerol-3-phosphate 3-phosphatidyltransferase